MPNRWEVPGGGCDEEDESILHGVARELREEAGLKAAHIGPRIGVPHLFLSRSGKKICRFNFFVEAEGTNVKLDQNEHQAFVWASEDEVIRKKTRDVQLDFTTQESQDVILESFRHIKEARGNT
jgi:8-oxo-dGTP pyrophosphatase MutT (NUDIX family)